MGNICNGGGGAPKGEPPGQPANPPHTNGARIPDAGEPPKPAVIDLGPPTDEYKVLVLGELNVGKTNLLLRFCDGIFVEEDPTHTKPPPEAHLGPSGIDRKSKVVKVGDEVVRLTVIDTMGNEKFRAVSSSVYAQLDGVLIVFGYDSRESLSRCQATWLRETDRYCNIETAKLLVGNKADIPVGSRQAEASKAQALARDCDNIPFFETSAKNNTNVEEVFLEIAKLIKTNRDRKKGIGMG